MDSRERHVATASSHGYGRPCGTPYVSQTWDLHTELETVTSYRGKVNYVQVGSKKRKAFNAFDRHKRLITPASQVQFSCPSSSDKTWSVNHATSYFLSRMPQYPATTNYYVSSGACPFLTPGSMTAFSNELLEFVKRDAFVKLTQPDFDGAVFIAELHETLFELKRILQDAIKGLAQTGKRKKGWKLTNLILKPDEAWLWFRYFLMPAMMDAEMIIETLKGRVRIDRVQDGDRLEKQKASDTAYVKMGQRDYSYPCDWETEWKFGAGAAIDIFNRFDPHPWGFSDWDVLRAIWERTPWSFVVDWFVNIGDWLASLREIEVDILQSYASFALECNTTVTFNGWFESMWEPCSPVRYWTYQMKRVVDIEPPTTPLVDLKWNSVLHTIDAISLATGFIRTFLSAQTRRR